MIDSNIMRIKATFISFFLFCLSWSTIQILFIQDPAISNDMGTLVHNGKAVQSEIYSALGLNELCKAGSTTPRILMLLSSVLERLIRRNEKIFEASKKKDVVTIFHGSRPPTLSIQQYLERIYKYSRCSPSCFVVAYTYIQTFLQRTDAYLTSLNVHRLLITSVMVAAKVMDDECCNNAYFAKVGGVSTAEMNRLEMKFLFSMDFRLHVTVEFFNEYCLQLEREGIGQFQINRPITLQKGRSQVQNQVMGVRSTYLSRKAKGPHTHIIK